jgi:hypothetical protein
MPSRDRLRIVSLLCLALGLAAAAPLAAGPARAVRVVVPPKAGAVAERAAAIVASQIEKRCGAKVSAAGDADLTIEMAIDARIGAEGYRIADAPGGAIGIIGGDERGLVYGAGRFLRTSRYAEDGFIPGTWRGASSPACPVRGIYLATHFGNFYEEAPAGELKEYIDELALWGINSLTVAFPHWQFEGFDDPAARRAIEGLKRVMRAARAAGMDVGLMAGNAGFKTTPAELLRTPVPDAWGRHGNFGVNLCPSNPKAREKLLADWAALLDIFADIGIGLIDYWPYDEGGCGCKDCWPWGGRGYPDFCRDMTRVARAKCPGVRIIVSTWTFDTPPAGEWEGLARFLEKDKSWVDFIQADAHEDFPRYPLEKGVPGGLPLVNFPEISMWGQSPWGGFGANPLPGRLERLWRQTEKKLAGGFPYSEGIYEDINKVVCAGLYWDRDRATADIVREYIAFEYSPDVVGEVAKAIEILEANHLRDRIGPSAEEAFRLIEGAEAKLTARARRAWRWRILYLRALIDREMLATKGRLEGETLKRAFEELTAIYHAERSHSMPIHPPVIR